VLQAGARCGDGERALRTCLEVPELDGAVEVGVEEEEAVEAAVVRTAQRHLPGNHNASKRG